LSSTAFLAETARPQTWAAPLKTDAAKEKLVAELERTIPDLMKKASIPGLTVAVFRDGKLLWTKGFGVKSTKTNEPVTEDTTADKGRLERIKTVAEEKLKELAKKQ
jgi:CubicO group peptidase (beta-lactamase class C family)